MSILKSIFISGSPGVGGDADRGARFPWENEWSAWILRGWRLLERDALQRFGRLFPEPAFQAIPLRVRL